jgi:dTDP-4-dehydrorhamnose 3,5-epimerase
MKILETKIECLFILELKIFSDKRGWFTETYNEKVFKEKGININFNQDNHSYSIEKGVLRGLHFQNNPHSQTKLVRCTRGKIFDVAVDLRKSSRTYLEWFGVELSEENQKMLLIPKGFAHGFVTLEANSEVQYKVDNLYNQDLDRTIFYDDPDIKIKWPLIDYILSDKDKNAPLLKNSDVNFI